MAPRAASPALAAAVALLLPLLALPWAAPPAAAINPGDWFVSGVQSLENQTKTMNGSIIISAGAVLTVRNSTIEFTLAVEGGFNITVHAGGSLILEQCTVRSAVEGFHYNFLMSGHLEVRGCDISDVRGDSGEGGLELDSSQFAIENSTFHHNQYFGLMIRSGSGTVRNTTFDQHVVSIFVAPGATPLIENVTMSNSSSFGLKISNSQPTVRNLTVADSPNFGIGANGGVFNIVGCRVAGGVVGIDAIASSSGRVEGCTVVDAQTAIRVLDSSLTVANCTLIGASLGINSTRGSAEVSGTTFSSTPVGVKVIGDTDGPYGGSATGNTFNGNGLGFELYRSTFFVENNTYGNLVTHLRLFHLVTLRILDPEGARARGAAVEARSADGAAAFTGMTDNDGEVTAYFEEYRELPNGTRQNMTPHGLLITYSGQVTNSTFNSTKEETIEIKLAPKENPAPLGVSRDALYLLVALLVIAVVAGIAATRLRKRKAAKEREGEIAARRRRRRGPRSGR